jgi:hypothetical protein
MASDTKVQNGDKTVLETGETAALADTIRRTMARIASGRGTARDFAEVDGLMGRRVDRLYEHGLSVARARARGSRKADA